jgi:hypothetical protein
MAALLIKGNALKLEKNSGRRNDELQQPEHTAEAPSTEQQEVQQQNSLRPS